jgi:integrase
MRKSEIFALTWADIDTDKGTVNVNKSMVKDEYGGYIIKDPKTYDSKRKLPLPQQIIQALPTRGKDSSPLFTMTFPSFQRRYATITEKLGLKGYTFHTLRHYNASIMHLQGIPDRYAAERMGHSTVNMLKRVYQHTFEDAHKSFDNSMTEYFDGIGI